MVRADVNVKSPGVECVSRGLGGERWVTFGELTRDEYSMVESEKLDGSAGGCLGVWVGILEGDDVRLASCRDMVFGVKSTRLTVGVRCSDDGKLPGRAGSSLSRFMSAPGAGRWVPAAIFAGSSENLG